MPEILGPGELAKRLGISKNLVHQRLLRGKLPEPDWRLEMGPVWREATIAAWENPRGADDLVGRIERDPGRVATLLHDAYGIIGDAHRQFGAVDGFDPSWWDWREEALGSLLYPDVVDVEPPTA